MLKRFAFVDRQVLSDTGLRDARSDPEGHRRFTDVVVVDSACGSQCLYVLDDAGRVATISKSGAKVADAAADVHHENAVAIVASEFEDDTFWTLSAKELIMWPEGKRVRIEESGGGAKAIALLEHERTGVLQIAVTTETRILLLDKTLAISHTLEEPDAVHADFVFQDDVDFLMITTNDGTVKPLAVCRNERIYPQPVEWPALVPPGREEVCDSDSPKCCVLLFDTPFPYVQAYSDRIMLFSPSSVGPTYAVASGKKAQVCSFQSDCVLVVSESLDSSNSSSGLFEVTIYDFRNKFIAFQAFFEECSASKKSFGGCSYVFDSSGKVFCLKEKQTRLKLNDLVRRNLFEIALSVASQSDQVDVDTIKDLRRLYGNHLHSKGAFYEASVQYSQTIGLVEPSYVVRKFLSAQRVENLVYYLEKLHLNGDPTNEHTTLLLTCYTKLKRVAKIDEFVREYKVDRPQAALGVLRDAGFRTQSLALAKRFSLFKEHLEVLINDLGLGSEALEIFRKSDKRSNSETFVLIEDPDVKCSLLLDFIVPIASACVNTDETALDDLSRACADVVSASSDPPINAQALMDKLSSFKSLRGKIASNLYNSNNFETKSVVFEAYLERLLDLNDLDRFSSQVMDESRHFLSSHKISKILGLMENRPKKGDDDDDDDDDDKSLDKVRMHLYEKANLKEKALEFSLSKSTQYAIETASRLYDADDENGDARVAWTLVVSACAREEIGTTTSLEKALDVLEKSKILSPSKILRIIRENSPNERVEFGRVSKYVEKVLSVAFEKRRDLMEDTKDLEEEIAKLEADVEELESAAVEFSSTKCGLSGGPLELPTVHFLSGNSYNLSALPDLSDLKDPKLVDDERDGGDARRRRENTNLDERFFQELVSPPDTETRFDVLTRFLGLLDWNDDDDRRHSVNDESSSEAGTSSAVAFASSDLIDDGNPFA